MKTKKPAVAKKFNLTSKENPINVNIKKANNGFVVSSWSDNGDVVNIAKTMDEAKRIAVKMLDGKK